MEEIDDLEQWVTVADYGKGIPLGKRHELVFSAMGDGAWHTVEEISRLTGYSELSVSSQLRDFRKPGWGFTVERRASEPDPENLNASTSSEYRMVL